MIEQTFNKPRETVDKAQGGRRQTSVFLIKTEVVTKNFEWSKWTLVVTLNKVCQQKRNQVPKSWVGKTLLPNAGLRSFL